MARQNPNVVSMRADDFTKATLRKMAAAEGKSLAGYLREAVACFARDPSALSTRAEIAAALGLPPSASAAEMLRALNDLLQTWGESDAPPPALPTIPTVPALQLSAETLAKIKKKGWTVDQFLAARKTAVKRNV